MFRFILVSTLLVAAAAQYQGGYNRDPKTAAILSEQRYLSGDGKFGAAYDQEDGTNFKEETDADGNRRGSYSYLDPSGQRKTVSYVAGKNGFQASGDHLPVAPAAPAHAAPQPQYQPQAQYQPEPQYQQQPQYQPQFSSSGRSFDNQGYDDGQYDPRWNDPSFSEQHSRQAPAPAPAPAPVHNYRPVPAPAPVAPAPQYSHYNHAQAGPQQHQDWTTQAPHRFQPPGKLQLNRTPDGFSYSFNKV
ncbi:cuticle protein 2 [Topomyia yanbarensis]|uniref:cuticle protein 2 n=1 Tax=Topomyia yanbarensis TaxID=2498891 RepID=UPI00273C5E4D|nr:cuticle protein 2 [Topomyia yanbarensis]